MSRVAAGRQAESHTGPVVPVAADSRCRMDMAEEVTEEMGGRRDVTSKAVEPWRQAVGTVD